MADPLKNLIGGLVSGFEAETGRQRLKDAAELGGNESALTNSGFNLGGRAKTLRPKTFTDSVFTGFRNASLTPEQRLDAERATYLNEATQLDMALKQQEFNDMRQGSRGIAELSDLTQGIEDPRERYRVIAANPRLARTAPKQYTALLGAAKQEIDMDQQIRKEKLETEALDRKIKKAENDARIQNAVEARAVADDTGFAGSFGDAVNNVKVAEDGGDPVTIAAAHGALAKLAAQGKALGLRMEVDEATGKMTGLVIGPGASDPDSPLGQRAIGGTSKDQDAITKGEKLRALIRRTQEAITPDTAGPIGTSKYYLNNRILAPAREAAGFEAGLDEDIVDARLLLTNIRSQAMTSLKVDSQMNLKEFALIEPGLPEIGFVTTAAETKSKLKELEKITDLNEYLLRRNNPNIPLEDFFDRLSIDEIADFVGTWDERGLFSPIQLQTIRDLILDRSAK